MRLFGMSVIVCKPMACQAGILRGLAFQAGIAQLVEHDLAKVGVASSSLVSRSSFLRKAALMAALSYLGFLSTERAVEKCKLIL